MRRIRHVGTKVWYNPAMSGLTGRAAPQAPADASADKKAAAPKEHVAKGRIVNIEIGERSPEEAERMRLLARLLSVEGRPAVTKAADAYAKAGFAFPEEEPVQVKLLEHQSEDEIREAIGKLDKLLGEGEIKRRELISSRLRRIEELAEENATRTAAEGLRRKLSALGS